MKSKLKAIGRSVMSGDYSIMFYYEKPEGGKDNTMPEVIIPANSWDHMQETVRAYNEVK